MAAFIPGAMRGITSERQLGGYYDLDKTRRGLTNAIVNYLSTRVGDRGISRSHPTGGALLYLPLTEANTTAADSDSHDLAGHRRVDTKAGKPKLSGNDKSSTRGMAVDGRILPRGRQFTIVPSNHNLPGGHTVE